MDALRVCALLLFWLRASFEDAFSQKSILICEQELDLRSSGRDNPIVYPTSANKRNRFNMRLTGALFKVRQIFVGPIPKFRGRALEGKHRFVPPATKGTRYRLWSQWRDEEEVLKYIAKPYVTADEELDYLDSIGLKHQDVDPLYTSTLVKPMQQRYAIEIIEKFERNRAHEILE